MSCSRWAKISAAFNACIKLHEMGELNERFLPTTINERVAEIANVHFEHWKKYGDNGALNSFILSEINLKLFCISIL